NTDRSSQDPTSPALGIPRVDLLISDLQRPVDNLAAPDFAPRVNSKIGIEVECRSSALRIGEKRSKEFADVRHLIQEFHHLLSRRTAVGLVIEKLEYFGIVSIEEFEESP